MRLAVLGSPIIHSKSPALHRAAYDALGLDWQYDAIDMNSAGLADFINSCSSNWRGLSLTMPLKRDVMSLLDDHDEYSTVTGAANTVSFSAHAGRRHLRGFNTDVCGLRRALNAASINTLERVHLLGSGATAASAIVAVHALGARSIELSTRSPLGTAPLIELMTSLCIDFTISQLGGINPAPGSPASGGSENAEPTTLPDLVISAIPGGSVFEHNFSAELRASVPLFDIAYDPWPSALAESWSTEGGPVISGLEMLLQQALLQVRIFVNGAPDLPLTHEDAVFSAMRAAIGSAVRP